MSGVLRGYWTGLYALPAVVGETVSVIAGGSTIEKRLRGNQRDGGKSGIGLSLWAQRRDQELLPMEREKVEQEVTSVGAALLFPKSIDGNDLPTIRRRRSAGKAARV